jgi:hypothetical protein
VLDVLPASAAARAQDSVVAAVTLAHRLGLTPLLDAVRSAYVAGLDRMLWVGVALSVAGAVVSALVMAGQRAPRAPQEARSEHEQAQRA